MIKVGLIGCGGMGTCHAGCYANMKDTVQVVAVADLNAEKAKEIADRVGGTIYATGEELIQNAEVDMVDICLPTYLHTKHAIMAMEKGYHVFMEKPACLNEEEAELLLETEKKTGVKMQIGQVVRFFAEYVWLKKVKEEGTYGKLISANFFRLSANPKWSWENWYNDYTKSGTMAQDLHIHDVDYVRYIMNGDPDSLSSHATRNAEGVIQQIFSTYEYGDTVITAEGCWDYPDTFPFSATFRAKFEKATVVFDQNGLNVYTDEGKIQPELNKALDRDEDMGINISNLGPYYDELKYFTDHLISGEPLEIAPLSEAVASLRLDWKEISLAGGAKK